MLEHFPLTAVVTETGLAGQYQANLDHGWGATLADGTAVRVHLTAKVKTVNTPTLRVGQTIRVARLSHKPDHCSVYPGDFEYISAAELARRIADRT